MTPLSSSRKRGPICIDSHFRGNDNVCGDKICYMETVPIDLKKNLQEIEQVVKKGFSDTPDSNLSDWFSFPEMILSIKNGSGVCLKCIQNGEMIGMVHAMEENPINGREGREKWVITCMAVIPENKGKGVGTKLLSAIEAEAKKYGAIKLFVHTNKDDERVIRFYHNNGYKTVGFVDDYYYDGSAIFLLKHLK